MVCRSCRYGKHDDCAFPVNCSCQHRKDARTVDKAVDGRG